MEAWDECLARLGLFPSLSAIYINDLVENVGGMISKFGADIKISNAVNSEEGCRRL